MFGIDFVLKNKEKVNFVFIQNERKKTKVFDSKLSKFVIPTVHMGGKTIELVVFGRKARAKQSF
jgi:hypothetical protein